MSWPATGRLRPGTLEDIDPGIGVPLEAALSFPVSRVLGLGVSVHENINAEATFFGLTGNLLVGDPLTGPER